MNTWCNHPRAANGTCPLCDLGHATLGFAAAVLPGGWGLAAGTCFLVYQLARAKTPAERAAALGQWGLGYLAGGRL
jgi:hypothetical protein